MSRYCLDSTGTAYILSTMTTNKARTIIAGLGVAGLAMLTMGCDALDDNGTANAARNDTSADRGYTDDPATFDDPELSDEYVDTIYSLMVGWGMLTPLVQQEACALYWSLPDALFVSSFEDGYGEDLNDDAVVDFFVVECS